MARKSVTKLAQSADAKAVDQTNSRSLSHRPTVDPGDIFMRAKERVRRVRRRAKGVRSWPISYQAIAGWVAASDFLLIVGAAILSGILYYAIFLNTPGSLRRDLAAGLFVALIFVGFVRSRKLYSPSQLLLWNVQFNNAVWIWCATFFLLSGWIFVWKSSDEMSRGAILLFWGFGLIALLLHRAFWRFFIERALSRGSLRGKKIIVVTRNSIIDSKLVGSLGRFGYKMMREFVIQGSSPEAIRSELDRAVAFVRGSQIEEILLIVKGGDLSKVEDIADQLRILPIPVTWIAEGSTAELVRQPSFELGPQVAVEMQRSPRSRSERALKRAVDVLGASAGLILLTPLIVFFAVAITLDSPGGVFFWQTRRGFNGKPFKICKFRSMTVREDGEIVKQATKGDARVTRVGAWIRATSIDELPQLYNVLRGEMSLVGPRPHAAAHDDQFEKTVEDYAFRHHVKPGITGWAQVHGYRGETRTLEAIQRRVELDRWYINNWSVWLDLSIVLRTFGEIVRDRNVY